MKYDYVQVVKRASDTVSVDSCQQGMPLAPMQDGARVLEPLLCQCLPRIGYRLLGLGVRVNGIVCQPLATRQCSHNTLLAIRNRITTVVVEDLAAWGQVGDLARLLHYGFDYRGLRCATFEEWVRRFPANRQTQLRIAHGKARMDGRNIDTSVSAFVKQESYYAKQNYTPRLIQGRSDTFLAVVGPAMYTIGNEMKRVWHAGHHIVYTSGMNSEQVGLAFTNLMSYHGPMVAHEQPLAFTQHMVFLEFDFSKFDGTQGYGARRYEQAEIHRYHFISAGHHWAKKVKMCLRATARTRGYTRDGHRFEYKFKRQSGDAHTSSANSDLDVAVISYLLAQHHIHLGATPNTAKMMVLGDDNLVRMPQAYRVDDAEAMLDSLRAGAARLGLELKVAVKTQWDAEFCSGRFYPVMTDGQLTNVWGPKIGRILFKYFWRNDEDGMDDKWLAGVVKSKVLDYSFIPVLRVVIAVLMGRVRNIDAEQHRNPYKFRAVQHHQPSQLMWDMLEFVYGLSQIDFVNCELRVVAQLREIGPPPWIISDPVIDKLIQVDVGEPVERVDL